MSKPFVSVIMPTYNTFDLFLKCAIESVLSQTWKDFEFIIIDDGSTNGNFEIIKNYKDKRILGLQNNKNMGLPYTLNKAIELSNGYYVARMDSDDISLPKRLEIMINFMEVNKKIDIAGSYYKEFGTKHRLTKLEKFDEYIRPTMLFSCPMCHPSVFFRKTSIEKYDIKYTNEEKAEDYNLWVRCSLKKEIKFGNIDKVLLKYRIHNDQLTTKEKNIFLLKAMGSRMKILDALRIKLSPEEIDLYYRFSSAVGEMSQFDFIKIDGILQKIIDANKDKDLYDEIALKRVLADKYRKEYFRRKFLLRQNCTNAYKSFSLKDNTSPLAMKYLNMLKYDFKNIFVR